MTSVKSKRLGQAPEEGIKAPVKVATIANSTLTGLPIISGYQLVANDRVLVKNNTDLTENGIYLAATGAWSRANDWNNDNDVTGGQLVIDANTGLLYRTSFSGTFSIGITITSFIVTDADTNSRHRDTLDIARADASIQQGTLLHIKEISSGDGGVTIIFDVIAFVTEHVGNGIFTHTANTANSFKMRDRPALESDTVALMAARTDIKIGSAIYAKERSTGNGGGGQWKAIDATTSPGNAPNTFDIVAGNAAISFSLIKTNVINPQAYGAAGDGVADDVLVLQRIADILEDNDIIRGSKGKKYKMSINLIIRNQGIAIQMQSMDISLLASATSAVYLMILDLKEFKAANCDFVSVEATTAYTILLDGSHATLATGHYTFEDCNISLARLALIQFRRIKYLKVVGSTLEDCSNFHGLGSERTQQFGFASNETIICEDNTFKNIKGFAGDIHGLNVSFNRNIMIDCAFGSKNQMSLEENGASGVNPMSNVTRPVIFSCLDNSFDYDFSRAKYTTSLFVSPEFLFSNTELCTSERNNVSVKNLPSGVDFVLYTMGVKDTFISRDNVYLYDCPLTLSPPLLRYTTAARFSCINDKFTIKQFNEFFIGSDGPANQIDMIDCDIELGTGIGTRPSRYIIGALTEAIDVNYKGNKHKGQVTGITFRPLEIGLAVITNLIITGNMQVDGTQPNTGLVSGKVIINNNIGINNKTDIENGITANAGGGQSSAVALTSEVNEVSTVASSGDSVKLLSASAGLKQTVINSGANTCTVYPFSGDDLGAGVNLGQSLAVNTSITYYAYTGVKWVAG